MISGGYSEIHIEFFARFARFGLNLTFNSWEVLCLKVLWAILVPQIPNINLT